MTWPTAATVGNDPQRTNGGSMSNPESIEAVLVALASAVMTYHYIEHAVALLLKHL